jgi:hypothetical protein
MEAIMLSHVFNQKKSRVHIRYAGQSYDTTFSELDIGALSGENEVRERAARYLNVSSSQLLSYRIERHENGNITIRPEAVFG